MLVVLPAGIAQAGCLSQQGYVFNVISYSPLRLDGFGKPKILQNNASTTATLSLSQQSSGTAEWSVNASVSVSAKYSFWVISGDVTATVGGSYTKSNYESQTVTISLPVPAHQYGILQGGVFRRPAYGHYYYDNGNCTFTSGEYINVKLPVVADAYADTTNSTGNVPWDQNNQN